MGYTLTKIRSHWLTRPGLAPAEPLWKRVPLRDADGCLLTDFMMLIPRLGQRPREQVERTVRRLQQVLESYRHVVVFADLNLKLNVLWVSVRPAPGICLELATAINLLVPEARLVAHRQHP